MSKLKAFNKENDINLEKKLFLLIKKNISQNIKQTQNEKNSVKKQRK